MKQVLPIIIFCCVGIAICVLWLLSILLKYVKEKYLRKFFQFDFDENVITIDLHKHKDKK